jgi:vacuolar-type H+-ATPase subunit H
MEKDLLQSVVEVEKEIQVSIEAEKIKAAEWLESVRVSCAKELEDTRKQLADNYSQSLERACSEAEQKGAGIVANAKRLADFLNTLPEDTVNSFVSKHISAILPANDRGEASDR